MKLHIRPQGKTAFSFRLRLLDRYVDAGETFETEDAAAFSADVAKHFFREWYHIDLKRSMDPELWAFECYRQNVDWSDRLAVEKFLSPGIKAFLLDHRDALDKYAEENRPERTPWGAMRANADAMKSHAVRQWVFACERAEQDEKDFAEIDNPNFSLRLSVVGRSLETALKSLSLALRMHAGVTNEKLVNRLNLLVELETHLQATRAHIESLALNFEAEQQQISTTMETLKNNRPTLS